MKTAILTFTVVVLISVVGASQTPVKISTAEDLAAIGASKASLKGEYLLVNDLTLENWTPVCRNLDEGFKGIFDGGGHTIRIVSFGDVEKSPGNRVYVGVFGVVENKGTVKNLHVAGTLEYHSGDLSLFLGSVAGQNCGTIANCCSTADIVADGGVYTAAKGFGQLIRGGLTNSTVTELVGVFAGGIVGANGIHSKKGGTVSNCYATGDVAVSGKGYKAAGGVVGRNNAALYRCYATGNIAARSDFCIRYAGGVAGVNIVGAVENCVGLNDTLEATGKTRKLTITGMGAELGNEPNCAFGAVGYDMAVNAGAAYYSGKVKNTYYRSDMKIFCEKDEDAERTDKNEDPKGKLARQAKKGLTVAPETLQTQEWWQSVYAFGNSDDSPWVWDDALKRPVLYWQTLAEASADEPSSATP
jgi:hypothetical protein